MNRKTIRWILLTCIMFLLISYTAISQLYIWDNLKQLQLDLSETDTITITRIGHEKRDAELLIINAVDKKDRMLLDSAFNTVFSSLNELFDIYNRHCRIGYNKIPGTLIDELERYLVLEQISDDYINKSELIIEHAQNSDIFENSRLLYTAAYDLKQLALLNKGRALLRYQDYPVIYAYQWESDITIMDNTPQRIVKTISYEEESMESQHTITNQISEKEIVTYIIQIAAHDKEIQEKHLKSIYSGDKKINMMLEANWYKYFIGPYENYEEAEKEMKSLNIKNAFIAAYLEGKRIGLSEAKRRESENR